jgi:hypothetical protein
MASGCGTSHIPPVKTEYKVVMPEDKYFSGCDVIALPDPKTLTNTQVAQLITDLVTTNRICHNNNEAIREFLEKAKTELETRGSVQINGTF